MSERTVLTGPSHKSLEATAFERAQAVAEEGIGRVLYLSDGSTRHDRIKNHWQSERDQLQLRTETLPSFVSECYEQVAGPTTLLPDEIDRRALEFGLDEIVDGHPWLATQSHAPATLVDAFDRRFVRFQNIGLTTPDRVDAEFRDSTLPDRIKTTTTGAFNAYYERREALSEPWHVSYGETFETVREQDLRELAPHVDVVILDGFVDPGDLQRQLLEELATSFPTFAILPTFTESRTDGVDAAVNGVRDLYDRLDFEWELIPSQDEFEPLQQLTTSRYRDEAPATKQVPEDLEWRELPTPEREVRYIARDIRESLAVGTDPDSIGVIVPGLQGYEGYLEDTFETYGLEYSIDTGQALVDTHVGSAVDNLLALAEAQPRADALTELVTNPVVDFLEEDEEDAVLTAHRQSDAVRVEGMRRHLPSSVVAAVDSLLGELTVLREKDSSIETACETVRTTLTDIGVQDAENGLAGNESYMDTQREESALSRTLELLSSFESSQSEETDLTPTAAFNRALRGATLSGYSGTSDDVVILDHLDGAGFAFEELYIVGLTTEYFPSVTRHPAYFERMVEAHPILEVLDDRLRDRYHFAMLVANADTVTLTTPSTDPDSTAVVRSPILDELQRVTGIEPTTGTDSRVGSREDLQRAIAPLEHSREAVNAAGERGDFTATQTIHTDRGIQCATERANPDLSPRDGLLDAETVEELYPKSKREPYSASRLERYVNCGFQFYMQRILGIDGAESIDRTPDPLESGTLIHDTLERFFTKLQSEPGDAVDITEYDQETLEADMLEVALSELESAAFDYEGLFYRRWLEQLFAGLGDPGANPYYSDPRPHEGEDNGLFIRFIERERDREGELVPAWFEAPFGDDLGGDGVERFAIDLPNGEAIDFHGYIDRIDVSVNDERSAVRLFDYKTGSTPPMTTTTGGTTFQLPLYLLAVEQVLDSDLTDFEELSATYYQTKPPNSFHQPSGIESKFDSTAELQQFLTDVLPQRLQTLNTAIEQGRFHTTVLTESEAKCEYCDYRESCDVRHHQRRERIGELEDDPETYVPLRATSTDFEDVFGGEADD